MNANGKRGNVRTVLLLITSLVEWIVTGIPGGLGHRIRYLYYSLRLRHIGTNVTIGVGVRISNPEFVSIGSNTWIDDYVIILAGPPQSGKRILRYKPNPAYSHGEGEVTIGDNCHVALFVVLQGHGGISIGKNCGIASGSLLYSLSHHYRNPNDPCDRFVYKFTPMVPENEQALITSPVVMEDNTAIGLNSVLLPGAIIRARSWIGANSLVEGEIPSNVIASGVPAKVMRNRITD